METIVETPFTEISFENNYRESRRTIRLIVLLAKPAAPRPIIPFLVAVRLMNNNLLFTLRI